MNQSNQDITDLADFAQMRSKVVIQFADRLEAVIEGLSEGAHDAYDDSRVGPSDAARMLFHVKEAHARMDAVAKALYKVKDFLDKVVVPFKMDAAGTDMVRIPELARSFSKQNRMSASFVDKEAGFQWLRENGHGDMIQETVNAGTLAAFVRSLIIEEGVDPPEDVVKVSTYNTTSITKYTPKGQ
jgi:hypothetical protein